MPDPRATIPASDLEDESFDVQRCALRVLDGSAVGHVLDPLPPRTLIGRHPWCDLALEDSQVSGSHCEVVLRRDGVRLRDLGSTNGVWIGGMRIYDLLLEPSTVFRVGETSLRFDSRMGLQQVKRQGTDGSGRLIGKSPAMRRLFDMLTRVAARDIPVLLLGETGTGKSAVAEALHHQSPRAKRPFVTVNCGALPAELVESTLFGHVKGAFTGAHRATRGLFEQADGGTILLDEVGELPLSLQPKLLTALETRRVRPVGGESEVEADFRLVTATNRDLWDDVAERRFRQDLFFRIAGIELTVPPLRERLGDIGALAEHFLAQLASEESSLSAPPRISASALRSLERYAWPGNLRELRNALARAMVLAGEDEIEAEHLMIRGWAPEGAPQAPAGEGAALEASYYERSFKDFKAGLLAQHERRYFELLMERVQGNITRGAREAGISRTYLLTMLRRYELYERPG